MTVNKDEKKETDIEAKSPIGVGLQDLEKNEAFILEAYSCINAVRLVLSKIIGWMIVLVIPATILIVILGYGHFGIGIAASFLMVILSGLYVVMRPPESTGEIILRVAIFVPIALFALFNWFAS